MKVQRIIREIKVVKFNNIEHLKIVMDKNLIYWITINTSTEKNRIFSLLRLKNFLKSFKFRQPYPKNLNELAKRSKRLIGKEVELTVNNGYVVSISLI